MHHRHHLQTRIVFGVCGWRRGMTALSTIFVLAVAASAPDEVAAAVQRAPAGPAALSLRDPQASPFTQPQNGTCTRPWRISLGAFPDGIGPAGYECPGCDHMTTGGDRAAAASGASGLGAVRVTIRTADGAVALTADVAAPGPGGFGQQQYVSLCTPPPYELTVESQPSGYILCPNSPETVVLDQAAFDRESGSAPGRGRRFGHNWYYWQCDAMGAVICSVKCWLECIGGTCTRPCDGDTTCPGLVP